MEVKNIILCSDLLFLFKWPSVSFAYALMPDQLAKFIFFFIWIFCFMKETKKMSPSLDSHSKNFEMCLRSGFCFLKSPENVFIRAKCDVA